jgi:hypothetical protein
LDTGSQVLLRKDKKAGTVSDDIVRKKQEQRENISPPSVAKA